MPSNHKMCQRSVQTTYFKKIKIAPIQNSDSVEQKAVF